jgi:hypothetical protein
MFGLAAVHGVLVAVPRLSCAASLSSIITVWCQYTYRVTLLNLLVRLVVVVVESVQPY